jgi:hypothetical protein
MTMLELIAAVFGLVGLLGVCAIARLAWKLHGARLFPWD